MLYKSIKNVRNRDQSIKTSHKYLSDTSIWRYSGHSVQYTIALKFNQFLSANSSTLILNCVNAFQFSGYRSKNISNVCTVRIGDIGISKQSCLKDMWSGNPLNIR